MRHLGDQSSHEGLAASVVFALESVNPSAFQRNKISLEPQPGSLDRILDELCAMEKCPPRSMNEVRRSRWRIPELLKISEDAINRFQEQLQDLRIECLIIGQDGPVLGTPSQLAQPSDVFDHQFGVGVADVQHDDEVFVLWPQS